MTDMVENDRIMKTTIVGVAAAAFVLAGCGSSSPTSSGFRFGIQSLVGAWASVPATTTQGPCTNFTWKITSVSGQSGSGDFTATCGSLQLAGEASGLLNGSTLFWGVSGTATPAGGAACEFSLGGNATLENRDQIRIPYSGTTCLGAISGVETLKKSG